MSTVRYPNRLREIREKLDISQSEAARRMGMPVSTLNRHEKENRHLDAFSIERYSRFYKVDPYELFVPVGYEISYE